MNNNHNGYISVYLMFLYEERNQLINQREDYREKQNIDYKWLSKDQIKKIKNISANRINTINILLKINTNKIKTTRSKLTIC